MKGMSREIPRSTKERAARLWLQGESYRRICSETKMSLGALSDHINELRKKTPDLDQLRELNMVLRRDESTVFDALRGGRLLEEVGQLGVSLDELEGFVKLSARISSERGVEAERFVGSSMRLMDWEAKTGKSYEEVVKDLEERTKQVEVLDAKAKDVQAQIQGLMERKAQLESEIRDAEGNLNLTLQKLNQAINTQERLKKLSLERVSHLAQFIEDFELLGFNANVVRELAEWRKGLTTMEIDPDRLGEFIKKGGSLERQLQAVEERMKSGETRLKMLTRMEGDLRRSVDDVKRVDSLLQRRYQSFICAHCGAATPREVRRYEVQSAMTMGQPLYIACMRCGATNTYDPRTILMNLGLEVLS
jgi:hypothetical protein